MPSIQHESIVQALRVNPDLVVSLLREGPLAGIPAEPVRIEDTTLTTLTPASYAADLVLRLGDSLALVVEVQLGVDPRKWLSWPVYLANLRARCGLEVALVVVAPDPEVARWSATPIRLGPPDWVLRPLVLGPDHIPVVRTVEEAQRSPELTLLSALAHGRGPEGAVIAVAALEAWAKLDIDEGKLYLDLILNSLSRAAWLAVEQTMRNTEFEPGPRLKRFLEMVEVLEGEPRGELRGEARGEARAILEVLDERGVVVTDSVRERVLACTDAAQLGRWLRRAVHARTAGDLFDA